MNIQENHCKACASLQQNDDLELVLEVVQKFQEQDEKIEFVLSRCSYLWDQSLSTLERLSGSQDCCCDICQLINDWKQRSSKIVENIQKEHNYTFFPKTDDILSDLVNKWREEETHSDNLKGLISSEHSYITNDTSLAFINFDEIEFITID